MQQIELTVIEPEAPQAGRSEASENAPTMPRIFVRRPSERVWMVLEGQDTDSRREGEFFAVARALAHDAQEYCRVVSQEGK